MQTVNSVSRDQSPESHSSKTNQGRASQDKFTTKEVDDEGVILHVTDKLSDEEEEPYNTESESGESSGSDQSSDELTPPPSPPRHEVSTKTKGQPTTAKRSANISLEDFESYFLSNGDLLDRALKKRRESRSDGNHRSCYRTRSKSRGRSSRSRHRSRSSHGKSLNNSNSTKPSIKSVQSPSNTTIYTHAVKLSDHNSYCEETSSDRSLVADIENMSMSNSENYQRDYKKFKSSNFADYRRSVSRGHDRCRELESERRAHRSRTHSVTPDRSRSRTRHDKSREAMERSYHRQKAQEMIKQAEKSKADINKPSGKKTL